MNVLSFDIEDWFHILDNHATRSQNEWSAFDSRVDQGVDSLLDLVAELDTDATFFCLGWIAERHPQVVRRIHDAGHEIGSHSYAHQLVYQQSPADFQDDLERSVKLIQDITGQPVKYYRAPGFSVTSTNAWAFDRLIEAGIEVDCSVFPTSRAHGGFPEFGSAEPVVIRTSKGELKEFPMNVASMVGCRFVFSGGGYFRLLPYWMIRYLMHRSDYVMTYFHPRDFDPNQPLVPGLSRVRRFKSYYGLAGAMPKLKALLKDFEFVSISQALRQINWNNKRVVTLAEVCG